MPTSHRTQENERSHTSHRFQALLAAAITVVIAVSASYGGSDPTTPGQTTDSEARNEVAGVRLERPFVVIDGTARNVRVSTMVNGEPLDAFTPVNLPTTIALDPGSANATVEVVVKNLGDTGTIGCAIGASQDLLVSKIASVSSNTKCEGVLP